MGSIILPARIESPHNLIMRVKEGKEWVVVHWQDGSINSLHSTDGADGVLRAREIDLHFEQGVGIG